MHVTSPFVVKQKPLQENNDNSFFYPMNQAQNVSNASMKRAQRYATRHNVQVTLAAAVLPRDEMAAPPDIFNVQIPLHRSAASEYPNIQPSQSLAFVQDMLSGSIKLGMEFDYLVLTNSDIAVVEAVYVLLLEKLSKTDKANDNDNRLYESLSINRRLIPTQ
jgi:hypothetical protein